MTAPTLPALRPGARVWRADGEAATVTEIGQLGVYARVDGERLDVILGLLGWRLALTCEHCDEPAEVQILCGPADEVLCRNHGRATGCGAAHARPIPRTVIRALYDGCERLA